MPTPDAALAGTIAIGDLTVNRLGFGAMRITGPGIWGEPADPAEARRTVARLRDLGVTFIDTAEAYGPFTSEEIIAEILHPYGDIVVATKGGHSRTGPDVWMPLGRPEFLIQGAKLSARRLKVEQIGLWQLHRIDPKVPREEQFGAIAELLREGVIRHAGLSEVSVSEIEAAQQHFPVASVQNRYNVGDRSSEAVLDYCTAKGIAFIPWRPIGGLGGLKLKAELDALGRGYGATANQLALAWLLKRSPMLLPIPGTSKVAHLEENVAAAGIELRDEDFAMLGGG